MLDCMSAGNVALRTLVIALMAIAAVGCRNAAHPQAWPSAMASGNPGCLWRKATVPVRKTLAMGNCRQIQRHIQVIQMLQQFDMG
jgi:hypothetical protein